MRKGAITGVKTEATVMFSFVQYSLGITKE